MREIMKIILKKILQQYGLQMEAIVFNINFDVDGSGGDGSLNPNEYL